MSAIDTFRRAMRRHEKRARRMGLSTAAMWIRERRLSIDGPSDDGMLIELASYSGPSTTFLCLLALAAVARHDNSAIAESMTECP